MLIAVFQTCKSDPKLNYFTSISKNDKPLGVSKPGDWLYSHLEKGQSLQDFQNSNPIKPSASNNIIYLKPIGDFTKVQRQQIEVTSAYLQLFFQLKTVVLKENASPIIPANARRIGPEHHEQLFAPYLRDSIVATEKPKDGIAIMGITAKDLYPDPKWNYVFGLATYHEGVAVTSIYRLQRKVEESKLDKSLIRLLKISSHEIGHIFGLQHCIEAQCVMNGTNSLTETDKSILRLCSNCQLKLNSSLKYDNEKRLKEIVSFFKVEKMDNEFLLAENDLKHID